ncbi:LacI family transcriptional regulator [Devosia sp. UYZn731]|uniref:LacI family DNA-binding transcriptional regulator n=1 Tax=Devosia sp. UYZn731 TaxID=3156345 RepID=UPI0033984FF7
MRSTLSDIARESGVSNATVDRVLNNRAGVHARTRDSVLSVAARLGYIAGEEDDLASTQKTLLDFILPADDNRFMKKLHDELEAQGMMRTDALVRLHAIEGIDPISLVAKLQELEGKSEGVGIVAIDHPAVRNAIRRLARTGTKVMTLVSDVQNVPRVGYVGIDNRSAGRLSGYLLSRFLAPGRRKVALFAGSVSYRGHEEREMGFRQMLGENRERLEVVGFSEIRDDDEMAYTAAIAHLDDHPDLAGIYNIGAGSRGIARALTELGRQDVVFIGHDLTDDTRDFLMSGVMDAVIDQNPRIEAREAIEQLVRSIHGDSWNAHPMRTQVILRENIPEELE